MPDDPAQVAASALAEAPAQLRSHANTRLLAAIARGYVLGTETLSAYLRLNQQVAERLLGRIGQGRVAEALR
jgi:hypothetical protein